MIDNLTFEMIKRIAADVGAIPETEYGRGLMEKSLCLEKTVTIKWDNQVKEHNIYSAKLNLSEDKESVLRGLLIDLSIDESYEYLFLFRFNSMPIHAIRVAYDSPEESFIRIYNEKQETWITPNIQMIAGLLSTFEKIVSWGILWEECSQVSDLYDIGLKLID